MKYFVVLLLVTFLCSVYQHVDANGGGVDMFKLYQDHVKIQKDYEKKWNDLVANGDIEKVEHKVGGKSRYSFELKTPKVLNMKMKDVFYMLQNWALLDSSKQHFEFKFNIGGDDFTFRLQSSNKQILVFTGGKAVDYETVYNSAKASTVSEDKLAKMMLVSAHESLNKQTKWAGVDKATADKLRTLMVIGQVAEAARPTDDFYKKLKVVMDEVTEIDKLSQKNFWKQQLNEILKGKDFIAYSKDTEYDNLLKKVQEYNNEKDKTKLNNLKTEVSSLLPPSNDFFKNIKKLPATTSDSNLKKIFIDLAANQGREKLTKTQYSNLVQGARVLIAGTGDQAAKKKIVDNLSSLNKKTLDYLAGSSVDVNEFSHNKWVVDIRKIKGKAGRIPGADKVFRQVLQNIAAKKADFSRKTFDDLFVLSIAKKNYPGSKFGGTQTAREELLHERKKSTRKRVRAFTDGDQDDASSKKPKYQANGEPVRTSARLALKKPCGRKRSGTCSVDTSTFKLVEDSFRWEGDTLSLETIDDKGTKVTHSINVDEKKMGTSEFVKERLANTKEAKSIESSSKVAKVGRGLGAFGTFVNILAAGQYYSKGEHGRAISSSFEVAHSIGGLSGINDVIERVTKRAFENVVAKTAQKIGLQKTMKSLSKLGAKAIGKSGAKILGRLAGNIPFVGLAFDIYAIAEDIKDLADKNSPTPLGLKIGHLVLDVTLAALSIVEAAFPIVAPITQVLGIALTIIRIAMDDFYLDIKEELEKVKGKGFGIQLLAFMKGFANGIVDVLTLGLGRQLRALEEQKAQNEELLRNLSNPANYFELTFKGEDEDGSEVGTIDFTAGVSSEFGGFLDVKLHEDGMSFTVTLPTVRTGTHASTVNTRTFSFDRPVSTIILGVGELSHPVYRRETAKLWMFIPVKSFDVIDRFEAHQSSRYGVYTGNDKDNEFFAMQRKKRAVRPMHSQLHQHLRRNAEECESTSDETEVRLFLSSYHYDLYGQGGDDRFFLGPQSSHVYGDEGNDVYFVPAAGGRAIINNFALDEEMDTLFLNVSYSNVLCYRDGEDIIISYCNSHSIKLKNWFTSGNEQFHRHIYLSTKDGVGIEIVKTEINEEEYEVTCDAISVDRFRSKVSQHIELTGSFAKVEKVTGSDYNDVIIGSDGNNVIKGGLGNDYLKGGNGVDVYLIKEGDGVDRIDNSATDDEEDTIVFEIPYTRIYVEKLQSDLVLYDTLNPSSSRIEIIGWFSGEANQHAIFISKDWINFFVETDVIPGKVPVTIDLKKSDKGVIIDLMDPSNSQGIVIDADVAQEVKSIFDSSYNDVIRGNEWGNVMSCTGGSDILRGNGGKDSYVIKSGCVSAIIENYNELREFDVILFECDSENIHLSMDHCSDDLVMKCQDDVADKTIYVLLKEWFQSSKYTHLMIKTSDKVVAFLPETKEEFESTNGEILPSEIELDKDCGGEIDIIDFSSPSMINVERFVAKSDACSFHIIGNTEDNYIDPGPGSPYGYQILAGGNGTDSYVIGYDYGFYNQIENYAEDGELDHLLFEVVFNDIYILRDADHIILASSSQNDSVRVIVFDYFRGEAYQHLMVHSADGVLFKLQETYPYTEMIMVDFSSSKFSQIISARDDSLYENANVITGSYKEENNIQGGTNTTKITGGNAADTIIGGPGDETLMGLDGNDSISGNDGDDEIFGGEGDDVLSGGWGYDVIYGGYGADIIDGGDGSDTVVFSGEYLVGVSVDLMIGIGLGADAEGDTYESIENILGSEFNDTLYGNDDDNTIRGYGGSDYIVPLGGVDILQGGLGSDIYQFDNAFGKKVVNNFATDQQLDLVVMTKTNWTQMCYFFLDDELEIVIYYGVNTPDAISRLHRDEDYLQIALGHWLRNETYRHLAFVFSDEEFVVADSFIETDNQIGPLLTTIEDEEFLSIQCIEQHRICLRFTYNSSVLNIASSNRVTLEYVHINNESVIYHPLILASGATDKIEMDIEITNLKAGVANRFLVKLTSCQVVVGMSLLIPVTTTPNSPANVVTISKFFNGFTLAWDSPSVTTDPNVNEYVYNITVSDQQGNENYEFTSTTTSFTTHELNSDITYIVSVKSMINDVFSDPSSQVTIRTSTTTCSNFINLPSHLSIERLELNSQQVDVAHFYCDVGYSLVGSSTAVCNEPRSQLPSCTEITCHIPIISNANLDIDGDTYTWHCHEGYEVSADYDFFSSVCSSSTGNWSPALQNCQMKPACETLTAPAFGQVSITTGYVGDTATYSCSSGYELQGPIQKTCTRLQSVGGQESIYWDPTADVNCVEKTCPDLLPQQFGQYSRTGIFRHGDTVTLTCNTGYYIQDIFDNPGSIELLCLNGLWNVHQKSCQPMIEVYNIIEQLDYVIGDLRYTFSSWASQTVDARLYSTQACNLMGATDSVYNTQGNTISCYRPGSLTNGPDQYNGIYSIANPVDGSDNRVCISDQGSASDVCTKLGYDQYTVSIYTSATALTTTKVPVSNTYPIQLSSSTQSCTYRISCRKRCTELTLLNGNNCYSNYEGQTCYFSCNTGYAMIGSSSRTCTGSGWTGTHPFCDGKF